MLVVNSLIDSSFNTLVKNTLNENVWKNAYLLIIIDMWDKGH